MGFINGLFALLIIITFILLIVGLINPKWVRMPTRGKSTLVFFVALIVCLFIFGVTVSDEDRAKQQASAEASSTEQQVQKVDAKAKVAEEEAIAAQNKAEQNQDSTAVQMKEEKAQQPSLTLQQRNAVRSAENYLSFAGFSRKGLINQLSSSYGDGYEKADATVAVDSLNVDWNEQAAKSAQQYLEMSGFSCKGLINQLSSQAGDKYTKDEATYGAKQAGACS